MKKIPIVPEIDFKPNLKQFVEVGAPTGQLIPIATWTTIIYSTIVHVFNSNYNPSTGVFTASAKGLYNVEGSFSQAFDPGGNFTLYIRVLVTGTSGTRAYQILQSEQDSSTAFNHSRRISKNLYLEEGDTVVIQAFNNVVNNVQISQAELTNNMSIVELARLD